MIELDHFWVRTPDVAGARAELASLGFVMGSQQVHAGTGTANAVYYFDNVYLELLWMHNEANLSAPATRRTRLLDRLRPTVGDVSPFGVSYRYLSSGPPDTSSPVPTWGWHAPFLPKGAPPIPIATNSEQLAEPIIFASLVTDRPDRWALPRQESMGLGEVTDLQIGVAGVPGLSSVLCEMQRQGVARFSVSPSPNAVITIDDGRAGHRVELRHLPITMRW